MFNTLLSAAVNKLQMINFSLTYKRYLQFLTPLYVYSIKTYIGYIITTYKSNNAMNC